MTKTLLASRSWPFFLASACLSVAVLSPAQAAPPLSPHLFLGTDLGWGSISHYQMNEPDRSGLQFDLKGLASFYLPNWVLDGGLGWQYGKRSGENNAGYFSKTFARGLFVEGSLRWGQPRGWQFGPAIQYSLVDDVGLGDGTLTTGEKALLGGVQVFYEWPEDGYRLRLGGKWMTDLNITNRAVQQLLVSFEIGWPLAGKAAKARPYRNPLEGIAIVTKDRATQKVKLVLDARRIEFDFDSSGLRADARAKLDRMAQFLVKHLDKWKTLHIGGHTDERGSVEYNQTLSEGRAKSVREELVRMGIPAQRLASRGYSELYPIEKGHDEYAWQRNRRVEFEFSGVTDLDLIVDGVNQSTTNSDPADGDAE